MKPLRTASFSELAKGSFVSAVCAILILAFWSSGYAQSGRSRRVGDSPSQDSTPPARAEPPRTQTAAKPLVPQLSFLIVKTDPSPSANIPSVGAIGFARIVAEGCAERLRKSPLLEVKAGGDMNRKEAIERAKTESETYVVWMELKLDKIGGRSSDPDIGSNGVIDFDNLYVNYVVYTPGTAKIKTQGSVMQNANQVGNSRIGIRIPRRGGRMPVQYALEQAGHDAANRIMEAFQIPLPPE